jgi:hypothetical protein
MTDFNRILKGQVTVLLKSIITIYYLLLHPKLEANILFNKTATDIIANQLKPL